MMRDSYFAAKGVHDPTQIKPVCGQSEVRITHDDAKEN
jgi:hypothetical protein